MKRGFTLAEMVVACTLLSLFLSGSFFALSSGLRNWRRLANRAAVGQAKLSSAERICADLRASILLAGSGSEEVVLKQGPEIVRYQLVAGKIRRQQGASAAYLTSENEVGRLSFSYTGARRVAVRLDDLSFEVYARNNE